MGKIWIIKAYEYVFKKAYAYIVFNLIKLLEL